MGSKVGNLLSTAANVAAAVYAPYLLPVTAAAGSKLNGGSWGDAAKSAGLAFAGSEVAPALGNAFSSVAPETAASLGVGGGANSLTDLLGQTTGGAALTGTGTIGGAALGLTNAAGLTNSAGGAETGLSRLLSGGGSAAEAVPSYINAPDVSSNLSLDSSGASNPTAASNFSSGGTLSGGSTVGTTAGLSGSGGGAASAGSPSSSLSDWNIPGVSTALQDPTSADPALKTLASSATSAAPATTGGSQMPTASNFLGTLLGGASTMNSNSQALDALKASQANSMNVLQPYLASGSAANTKLSDLLGTNPAGTTMSTADILAASPQYQFQLDQGNQALDRQQAARGNYFSGGAIKEAQQFAQGLANQTAQQYTNNLAQQAGQGLTTANAAGNIYGNTGAAQANAITANNGVFNQTLSSLLSGNGAKRAVNVGGQIVYV